MLVLFWLTIRNKRNKHLLLRRQTLFQFLLAATQFVGLLFGHRIGLRGVFHLAKRCHLVGPFNHHIHLCAVRQQGIGLCRHPCNAEGFLDFIDVCEAEPFEAQAEPCVVSRRGLQVHPCIAVVVAGAVQEMEIEEAVEIGELINGCPPFERAVATNEVALLQFVQTACQSAAVGQTCRLHYLFAGIAAASFAQCRDNLDIRLRLLEQRFVQGVELVLQQSVGGEEQAVDILCETHRAIQQVQIMTNGLIKYFISNGLKVEARDKEDLRLTAYRRSIYFPNLLFDLHLTGHREERFLMKIEAQDQGVPYQPQTAIISRNGFLFPVTVPSKGVLLSMKLSALLARAKGRDFYDAIFLWQQTAPDYGFLSSKCGVHNSDELRDVLTKKLELTNLSDKQKDFEHLLFASSKSNNILYFKSLVDSL